METPKKNYSISIVAITLTISIVYGLLYWYGFNFDNKLFSFFFTNAGIAINAIWYIISAVVFSYFLWRKQLVFSAVLNYIIYAFGIISQLALIISIDSVYLLGLYWVQLVSVFAFCLALIFEGLKNGLASIFIGGVLKLCYYSLVSFYSSLEAEFGMAYLLSFGGQIFILIQVYKDWKEKQDEFRSEILDD